MKNHKVCTIIAGVLLFSLLLNGAVLLYFQDRVLYFDVADYLDRQTGTEKTSGMSEYYQYPLFTVDKQIRRDGRTESGELKTPENTPDLYAQGGGVILVVRPVGLRQNLMLINDNAAIPVKLWETTPNPEFLTKTTVVIEEVLYQSEYTNYRAGQTVIVREGYGIVDGRCPVRMETFEKRYGGSGPYAHTTSWTPMENGEVYVVYGSVWDYVTESGKKYEPATKDMVIARADGVYCLSDPEKCAGWHTNSNYLGMGNSFLRNEYPHLIKYEDK
jgi:hypothetical protein